MKRSALQLTVRRDLLLSKNAYLLQLSKCRQDYSIGQLIYLSDLKTIFREYQELDDQLNR